MTTALVPSSPMTEREFGGVFAKLAMQLRWTDADAVAIKSYFDALKDLPLIAIQQSASMLANDPGRRFFPTTGEWRAAAEAAKTTQLRKAVAPTREEPWRTECTDCEDCGWAYYECTGDSSCGRRQTHQAHTYVRVCPCRPTNRTFQRHQHFGSGA